MAAKKEETKARLYKIETLRKYCGELFGVQPYVFDGAMTGVKGPIAKAEAVRKINDWLRKGAK